MDVMLAKMTKLSCRGTLRDKVEVTSKGMQDALQCTSAGLKLLLCDFVLSVCTFLQVHMSCGQGDCKVQARGTGVFAQVIKPQN